MQFKVVPFPHSKDINGTLQHIIDQESASGWKYVNHHHHHYLKPGTSGCFGIGAKPDTIWHVGNVVFEKS